jgi:hypothetical protein
VRPIYIDDINKKFPIISEECEPFAARMIGVMFARAQAAKSDPDAHIDALRNLWLMVEDLNHIAILASTATHFSIAANNHMGMLDRFIRSEIGVEPYDDPTFRWR